MASVKPAGVEKYGMLTIIHPACFCEHLELWEQVASELNVSTANLGSERAWIRAVPRIATLSLRYFLACHEDGFREGRENSRTTDVVDDPHRRHLYSTLVIA